MPSFLHSKRFKPRQFELRLWRLNLFESDQATFCLSQTIKKTNFRCSVIYVECISKTEKQFLYYLYTLILLVLSVHRYSRFHVMKVKYRQYAQLVSKISFLNAVYFCSFYMWCLTDSSNLLAHIWFCFLACTFLQFTATMVCSNALKLSKRSSDIILISFKKSFIGL